LPDSPSFKQKTYQPLWHSALSRIDPAEAGSALRSTGSSVDPRRTARPPSRQLLPGACQRPAFRGALQLERQFDLSNGQLHLVRDLSRT
jgi:hypothetical protein